MKFNLFIPIFILLISSCSVYVPQTHAPILIENKGELQIDAGADATFTFDGSLYINTTYGISNKLLGNIHAHITGNGLFQTEASFGLNQNLGQGWKTVVMGGYAYGTGNISLVDIVSDEIKWSGHFSSLFARGSIVKHGKFTNFNLGMRVGTFNPSFVRREYENSTITFEENIVRSGIILEPFFTLGFNLNERTSLNITQSIATIKPIGTIKYPDNISGVISFGFGITYLTDTKTKKVFK